MLTAKLLASCHSMDDNIAKYLLTLGDVSLFTELGNLHLRSYQHAVARAITDSVSPNPKTLSGVWSVSCPGIF